MAGNEKGVAARILRIYPLAPYIHCFSHKLNLCVIKVTQIASIRDMFEHSRCISDFFGASPRRYRFFEKEINSDVGLDASDKKTLINVCRTRYVHLNAFQKLSVAVLFKQCQIQINN